MDNSTTKQYYFPLFNNIHRVKSVLFGVFLVCIQFECGKIGTRKTPNMDTFHAVMIELFFRETVFFLVLKRLRSN